MKQEPAYDRRGHAATTASASQLAISKRAAGRRGRRKQRVAGELPQGKIAREQRGSGDEAPGRHEGEAGMDRPAHRERNRAEHGRGMEQQHRGGRHQPRRLGLVRGKRREDDAAGAHQAGQANQNAMHPHQLRSSSRRTMAARSSGMPAPLRDDVASTSGNAAGWLASAAVVSAMRASSSACLTWSALVRTT